MDFEPWLRDQLSQARGDGPVSLAPAPRPGRTWRLSGLRAGFAGAGVAIVAIGLLSGRALPVLQLTNPPSRARDLPVSTWAGVPSAPPGAAELASGRVPAGLAGPGSAATAEPGLAPAAGSATGSPGTGTGAAPAEPNPAAPGPAAAPVPASTPDDHGGRSPGGPSPAVSVSPSADDGGRHGSSPSPSSSPTSGGRSGGSRGGPSPSPG